MGNTFRLQFNLTGTDKNPEIVANHQYQDLSHEELGQEIVQIMNKSDWKGTVIVQRVATVPVPKPETVKPAKATKKTTKKVAKKPGRPKKADAAK